MKLFIVCFLTALMAYASAAPTPDGPVSNGIGSIFSLMGNLPFMGMIPGMKQGMKMTEDMSKQFAAPVDGLMNMIPGVNQISNMGRSMTNGLSNMGQNNQNNPNPMGMLQSYLQSMGQQGMQGMQGLQNMGQQGLQGMQNMAQQAQPQAQGAAQSGMQQ